MKETAVTAAGQAWPGKAVHYRMHPANVGCLKQASVHACALANSHTLDWSEEGLSDTLRSLAKAGVRTAGARMDLAQAQAPAVLSLGAGHRLLVFSWAAPDSGVPQEWEATPRGPGIALLQDLAAAGVRQVVAAVDEHRREGDLVVLSHPLGHQLGGRGATRAPPLRPGTDRPRHRGHEVLRCEAPGLWVRQGEVPVTDPGIC